jgi:hypothetical protein
MERFIAYKPSLRTGELPAHIDLDLWRRWLRLSRGSNRIAQLLAYLAVVFVVVPSLTRQPEYHPVFASSVACWPYGASSPRGCSEIEQHLPMGDNRGTRPSRAEVVSMRWPVVMADCLRQVRRECLLKGDSMPASTA